MLSRVAPTGG